MITTNRTNLIAFPTRSGNGFEAFKLYEFTPINGCAYSCTINGAERVDSLDGRTSAHLYTKENDQRIAGRFVAVTNHRQRAVMPFAYAIAAKTGVRVWLSKDKTHGFFECRDGFVMTFGSDFGAAYVSGCYRPINREDGRKIGRGWRDNTRFYSPDDVTDRMVQSGTGAPSWATGGRPVAYVTADQHLAEYGRSSGYTLINPFGDQL